MSLFSLPAVPSLAHWPSVRRTHGGWHAAMQEICARHGLPASELTRTREGTTVVFTTDRHVIKLYPPFWEPGATAEWAVLEDVENQLGVPTPAIVATGRLELWPYLVMTRLTGTILDDAWPGLAPTDRRSLARQLGEVLARLHARPTDALAAHAALRERWPRLASRSTEECVAVHRAHGATDAWLDQLRAFLERRPALHPADFTPVLVSGDIHGSHLLAVERDGGWQLTGLYDFDDAMLAWWEYELAAPAVFLMAGQPAVLDECLRGYGGTGRPIEGPRSRRLLTYMLLNRYWGLDFILRSADPDRHCATFDDLERVLFPTGA